jgi:hypothetical protein
MCSDFGLNVTVLESIVGGHGPQVVRIPADGPRVSLRVMLTLNRLYHVWQSQQLRLGAGETSPGVET